MAFYDKFPYTNFQELNLDWLTQEVSKVRDNRDASDASAAAALASEQAAKASETAAAASQQAAANSETAAAGSEAASAEYLEQIGTHTAGAVADWLKENITATTPPIDASLTVSGAAADAKVTGDRISDSLNGMMFFKTIEKKYINPVNGKIFPDNAYTATDFISTYGNDEILTKSSVLSNFGAWYNSEMQFISGLSIPSGIVTISVPSNAAYFRTSFPSESISDFKVYSKVGKAAEKIETFKEINCLNGNDIHITNDKYVNYENGLIGTHADCGVTDKIPVVGGMTYGLELSNSNYEDSRGLAFYANDSFISGVKYIKNQKTYILNVPENANKMALTVTLNDAIYGYFKLQAINNIIELIEFVKRISNENNVAAELTNVFAFNTVGIIGDSLASGCSNYKDSQNVWHALDRKAFSWGKFFEKRQGCSVSLFSQGGMSTRSWFTNPNGYAKALNDPRECYYIGLGVNDYSSLGDDYLGTISDIHIGNEDYNADTFYGNYSKIIAKLTTIQPRCKIFCFTMAGNQSASATRLNYDTAIREIVALYDNAYLLDLSNDTFFTSDPLVKTWYGAHYLATGYSMIADHIFNITNKFMLDNLEEFADIQWITNNYPNTDKNS